MSPASFRPKRSSAHRVLKLDPRLYAVIFAIFLLVPAVVIFCYQWSTSTPQASAASDTAGAGLALAPRAAIPVERAAAYSSLKPVRNPMYGLPQDMQEEDPFEAAVTRAMMTAQGDPFLYALAAGNPEGDLTVKEMNGRVPVLGPPGPSLRSQTYSDREILRMLQTGVGGSFRNFFSNVFGERRLGSAEPEEVAQEQDENPFRKARESLSEPAPPAKPADPAAETPTHTTPPADTTQQAASKETPAPKVEIAGPGAVTTSRPNLMLRVAEDGNLESIRTSHPREGVFESAEMGVRDFDVLPFSEPAEFPMAIAVADLNGDGVPDAAVKVGFQATIRLFMGQPDGTYQEQVQIEVGRGPRSIVAADFDGDGRMDIAISGIGTGVLTVLYSRSDNRFRYETRWTDEYRDYILAADPAGSGRVQLVGMSFANRGTVLMDFAGGTASGLAFDYSPALSSEIATAKGWAPRINAVVLNGSMAVSLDNRRGLLTNVVTVSPGTGAYLLVGDVGTNGSVTVGIATPRH